MKRILYILLLALTSICAMGQTLTVAPVEATAGEETELVVTATDMTDITALQFNISLPEGVTFSESEVKKGAAVNGHTLNVQTLANGDRLFILYNMNLNLFSNGELLRIPVNVANEAQTGNGSIYTIRTSTDEAVSCASNSSEYTLTVTPSVVLDETSLVAPTDADDVNVRVLRTINANEWSTIVLPFAMSNAQLKAAFGDDVQLADFTSWSSEEDETPGVVTKINIGFTDVTALEANHPYIIKVSTPITEFSVEGVNITVEAEPTVQVGVTNEERGLFKGTYVAQTAIPEDNLFLNDNKFWYSTGATKTKAFRGFFELADVLADVENAGVKVLYVITDPATEISEIATESATSKSVYTIQGTFLGNDVDINSLPKGVYIIDGKKVLKK